MGKWLIAVQILNIIFVLSGEVERYDLSLECLKKLSNKQYI